MSRSKLARKLAVPMRDFMLGLGIFLVLAFVCTGVSVVDGHIAFDVAHARFLEPAGTAEMVTVTDASVGQFGRELQRAVTFGLLAMTFALMFAVNVWFVRHVRRAYSGSGRK
jgi:hypothetical protein